MTDIATSINRKTDMNASRLIGIVLIVLGGLAYFTKKKVWKNVEGHA